MRTLSHPSNVKKIYKNGSIIRNMKTICYTKLKNMIYVNKYDSHPGQKEKKPLIGFPRNEKFSRNYMYTDIFLYLEIHRL